MWLDSQRADERCLRRTGTGRLSSAVFFSESRPELGDFGLTFTLGGTFESLWGKRRKSEHVELISAQWSWDTLSVGLTVGCRQLWGEGARAHPGWTSFLSSQRLRLQAEVCRELELPERPEDRESEGGGHEGFRFHPKLCWRPSEGGGPGPKVTPCRASEYGNVLLADWKHGSHPSAAHT